MGYTLSYQLPEHVGEEKMLCKVNGVAAYVFCREGGNWCAYPIDAEGNVGTEVCDSDVYRHDLAERLTYKTKNVQAFPMYEHQKKFADALCDMNDVMVIELSPPCRAFATVGEPHELQRKT